jgi:hypothetical protein
MVDDLHVIVRRDGRGGYVSTISGLPDLKVMADSMEALREKTLELVRENTETLERGLGSRLDHTSLSDED